MTIHSRPDTGEKRTILGVDVRVFDWRDALVFCRDAATRTGPQSVVAFLNAHNANIATGNERFRDALNHFVVLPDGVGVDFASSQLYDKPFPANLNGTDFVPALLTFIEKPMRIALIGGRPEVLANACNAFKRATPWHEFIAITNGYYDRADTKKVVAKLAAAKADILLVALGSPAQELWIAENVKQEHAGLVLAVGALFDFVAGAVPRAPLWMRKNRLEWVFRLWMEPKRLWWRYVIGNPVFLYRVLRYKMKKNRRENPVPVT